MSYKKLKKNVEVAQGGGKYELNKKGEAQVGLETSIDFSKKTFTLSAKLYQSDGGLIRDMGHIQVDDTSVTKNQIKIPAEKGNFALLVACLTPEPNGAVIDLLSGVIFNDGIIGDFVEF